MSLFKICLVIFIVSFSLLVHSTFSLILIINKFTYFLYLTLVFEVLWISLFGLFLFHVFLTFGYLIFLYFWLLNIEILIFLETLMGIPQVLSYRCIENLWSILLFLFWYTHQLRLKMLIVKSFPLSQLEISLVSTFAKDTSLISVFLYNSLHRMSLRHHLPSPALPAKE